jgi:hypothetical protein
LRPFPCALLVERKWRTLWTELEEGWEGVERWLRPLETIWSQLADFDDGAAVLDGLRGRKVVPEAATTAIPEPALETWSRLIWPPEEADGLEGLLGMLRERARRGASLPIQLPLAVGMPLAPQIHAWWCVAAELGFATRRGGLGLFFPRDAKGGAPLTLFPRATGESPVACLASAEGAGSQGADVPGDPMAPATAGSEPSLAKSLCARLGALRP